MNKEIENNLVLTAEEKRLLWAAMKAVEMLFDQCRGCEQGTVPIDMQNAVASLVEKLADNINESP